MAKLRTKPYLVECTKDNFVLGLEKGKSGEFWMRSGSLMQAAKVGDHTVLLWNQERMFTDGIYSIQGYFKILGCLAPTSYTRIIADFNKANQGVFKITY